MAQSGTSAPPQGPADGSHILPPIQVIREDTGSGDGHRPVTMVRYKTRELLARALWKETKGTLRDYSGYTFLIFNALLVLYCIHWVAHRSDYDDQYSTGNR